MPACSSRLSISSLHRSRSCAFLGNTDNYVICPQAALITVPPPRPAPCPEQHLVKKQSVFLEQLTVSLHANHDLCGDIVCGILCKDGSMETGLQIIGAEAQTRIDGDGRWRQGLRLKLVCSQKSPKSSLFPFLTLLVSECSIMSRSSISSASNSIPTECARLMIPTLLLNMSSIDFLGCC